MKNIVKYVCIISFLLLSTAEIYANNKLPIKPINLKTEYLINPIGIDVITPRLSWEINDERMGALQNAYRILISKDSIALTRNRSLIWDSGKVLSSQTSNIQPDIKCEPMTRYYWKVIFWDKNKKKSANSEIAYWETGIGGKWQGKWISDGKGKEYFPAPLFRKEVTFHEKIARATAYICGLGYYELYINGDKIGNHILDPGFTRFDKKTLYVTYDLTQELKQGKNAFGVILGNGWYNIQSHATWNFHNAVWRNRPTFILNIRVEYESGKTDWIVSDESWKTSTGAIRFNNLYSGEYYDAGMEPDGWNRTGFDDKKWNQAKPVECPSENIIAQSIPPIRIKEEIKAVSYKRLGPNHYVYDLGRNIAGVCRFTAQGEKKTKIRIKHGEKLYPDGTVDISNIDYFFYPEHLSEDFQTDIYIMDGKGQETYIPKFTYHGFQYVEVIADKPITLDINSITGLLVHTDLTSVGTFNCSNELLNKIYEATRNAYISNIHSIPTDCPTREKNGWTADAHTAMEFALFNFDGYSFYEKWIRDFYDVQKKTGELPDIVPTADWGYPGGNPAWDAAFFIIPNEMYMYYGNPAMLKEPYEYYKKYLDFIGKKANNYLLDFRLWDWCTYKASTPVELTSSMFYYTMTKLMAKSAKLNGKISDIQKYEDLAKKIRKAINDKFYNSTTGIYANGTQTAQSYALYSGIVPEGQESKVARVLADSIQANGNFLDFGLFGSKSVLNILSEYGYHDIAYKMITQTECPSLGWWIKKGATTLWEAWDGNESASLNHVFLGEASAWMIKKLAGINYLPEYPGFTQFLIAPQPVKDLSFVRASYHSIHGEIISEWKKTDKGTTYYMTIPANTTAQIVLPKDKNDSLFINNKNKYDTQYFVSVPVKEKNKFLFTLSSGKYVIEIRHQ